MSERLSVWQLKSGVISWYMVHGVGIDEFSGVPAGGSGTSGTMCVSVRRFPGRLRSYSNSSPSLFAQLPAKCARLSSIQRFFF